VLGQNTNVLLFQLFQLFSGKNIGAGSEWNTWKLDVFRTRFEVSGAMFLLNSAFLSFCSEVTFLSRRHFAAGFLGRAATGVSRCTLLGACRVANLTHSYVLCYRRNATFYNGFLLKLRNINPYFMELHDKESSLERCSVF
jgi:hypothetical protein